MPRDYKHVNKPGRKPAAKADNPLSGNLLSFFTGLAIGLFIALLVFLEKIAVFDQVDLQAIFSPAEQSPAVAEDTAAREPDVPSPTFDFYKILPNKEINISEYVADDAEPDEEVASAQERPAPEDGIYVLQVGSFREYEAADRLKAELTLLGITPEIQRVVINGQDIHYRVRVGPYNEASDINAVRRRLRENDLEYMLLKLEAEQEQTEG